MGFLGSAAEEPSETRGFKSASGIIMSTYLEESGPYWYELSRLNRHPLHETLLCYSILYDADYYAHFQLFYL